jgi:hypothetical protein
VAVTKAVEVIEVPEPKAVEVIEVPEPEAVEVIEPRSPNPQWPKSPQPDRHRSNHRSP